VTPTSRLPLSVKGSAFLLTNRPVCDFAFFSKSRGKATCTPLIPLCAFGLERIPLLSLSSPSVVCCSFSFSDIFFLLFPSLRFPFQFSFEEQLLFFVTIFSFSHQSIQVLLTGANFTPAGFCALSRKPGLVSFLEFFPLPRFQFSLRMFSCAVSATFRRTLIN